jgi:flagellum-specific peptidoglycan hydrolase FlgJ
VVASVLYTSCSTLPVKTQREDPPALSPEGAKTEAEKAALINWLASYAVKEQQSSGVPASITIAQAILETGWMRAETPVRRKMVLEAKNLFGIKGVGPAGSVEIPTTEYEGRRKYTITDKFRAYHTYAESFEDHSHLLTTSSYYTGALKFRNDPHKYIEEVAKNYATDPEYATEVWSIVTRYNLTRFDKNE